MTRYRGGWLLRQYQVNHEKLVHFFLDNVNAEPRTCRVISAVCTVTPCSTVVGMGHCAKTRGPIAGVETCLYSS